MMLTIFTLTPEPMSIVWRALILPLCVLWLLWFYVALRCHFSDKEKWPLHITMRRAWIEASLIGLLALAVYFLFFVRACGWQRFVWDAWYWSFSRNTYLMLLPEILTLIGLAASFFIQTKLLLNSLKLK